MGSSPSLAASPFGTSFRTKEGRFSDSLSILKTMIYLFFKRARTGRITNEAKTIMSGKNPEGAP